MLVEETQVLVTGANGFVGRAACLALAEKGCQILGVVRGEKHAASAKHLVLETIDENTNWTEPLSGIDCVVHLIAKVHDLGPQIAGLYSEYQRVNVGITMNLARQAAAMGVRRFVYMSSIKVNGEYSLTGQPFNKDSVPRPEDFYGITKLEAEKALIQLGYETGMEITIIRPPLVYGPGVKANFATLMRHLSCRRPVPLGLVVDNRRSLIALDNLVDFMATCITHPAAANQTFLVSDGEDVSTAMLVKKMGVALGKPARLLPVPLLVLRLGALLVGKPEIYPRLCNSLQIDTSDAREALQWRPPIGLDEGLSRVAKGFVL